MEKLFHTGVCPECKAERGFNGRHGPEIEWTCVECKTSYSGPRLEMIRNQL